MEHLPKIQTLEFNPNTLEDVRKLYDLDKPGRLDQAIDALVEWIKKQNHFKRKEFDRGYLERILISKKGSVERAKTQIDKICTLRTLMPIYFQDSNLESKLKKWRGVVFHALIPKMTQDNDRVLFIKNAGRGFESDFFLNCYKYYIMFAEYVKAKDYANRYSLILDFTEVNMTEISTKMSPLELRQFLILSMDGYGVRVKGIHILTESKLVDLLVTIFKQVFSEKLAKRVFVHKNLDSLKKLVPEEILPKDYGGMCKSLAELDEMWFQEIFSEEFQNYWMLMNTACTDESFRQTDKFNEQYLGMPGTFRTLSTD